MSMSDHNDQTQPWTVRPTVAVTSEKWMQVRLNVPRCTLLDSCARRHAHFAAEITGLLYFLSLTVTISTRAIPTRYFHPPTLA